MVGVVQGTGSFLPEREVSNHQLSQKVETSDEWIRERTGVINRRIISNETTTSMATIAAKRALDNSGISPLELDMILVATISSDVIMPNTACIVQEKIGAKNALCFDINSACSGFLYAYNTAQAYIGIGLAKKVLVIGAESLSRWVDWSDRGTCILFGDGAGAVVLSSEKNESFYTVMHADGGKGHALTCRTLGPHEIQDQSHLIGMKGQEVFKFAVRQVPQVIEELLLEMNRGVQDIDLFLLHQANRRIVESVAKRLESPIEKFPMNLEQYGNTSSASIPILLDELNRSGKLQSGMKMIMAGFGGGLTWGGTYLEWK